MHIFEYEKAKKIIKPIHRRCRIKLLAHVSTLQGKCNLNYQVMYLGPYRNVLSEYNFMHVFLSEGELNLFLVR